MHIAGITGDCIIPVNKVPSVARIPDLEVTIRRRFGCTRLLWGAAHDLAKAGEITRRQNVVSALVPINDSLIKDAGGVSIEVSGVNQYIGIRCVSYKEVVDVVGPIPHPPSPLSDLMSN